jgi:phosphoserine phosphatase
LADALARCLGLDGALGTEIQRAGDVFTGRLDGPLVHGPAKANAVVDLAAARAWELRRCAAYSDSAADLPLLSAVGYPAVVNPERGLAGIARRRGWDVYDFRARHLTDRLAASLWHRPDGTGRAAAAAVARMAQRIPART